MPSTRIHTNKDLGKIYVGFYTDKDQEVTNAKELSKDATRINLKTHMVPKNSDKVLKRMMTDLSTHLRRDQRNLCNHKRIA